MTKRLVPTLAIISGLLSQTVFLSAEEADLEIDTVDITATRLDSDPHFQPYAFYRHDKETMDSNTGRTALDRINYGPGVFIQHTAPSQTSPFIRGLTGKQTLLMFDGIRLSHATMRGGPNQYAAMIPNMSIQGIDVILGSSSVPNGSDGLTGAVDFRLAEAGRGVAEGVSPWAETRLDSANGMQISTGIDGNSGDWLYSLEGSLYDFHDRVGGRDADDHVFGEDKGHYEGIPNTAYEQYAWAGRAAYVGKDDHRFEAAVGTTRQNDTPRPDGYAENSGSDTRISRKYLVQEFNYLHLRHLWTPDSGNFEHLRTSVWWHQHYEDMHREDLTSGGTVYRRREFDDTVDSMGIDVQAKNNLEQHELIYGATILFETTSNEYREFRNLGGTDPAGATEYQSNTWDEKTTITDGAEYNTYALFVQDLWHINEDVDFLAGLRYTMVDWDFDVASSDAQDVTGSLRATWRYAETMSAFAGLSKAFRAPNLNDLDGATDRGSSGTPAFGNPDLDPEYSYTLEAGWRYRDGEDQVLFNVFVTRIEDIIQTVYDGGSGEINNGEGADIQGFEVLWDYGVSPSWVNPNGRLAVIGSLSYVDTEIEIPQSGGGTLKEPLSRANRLYGYLGLRYDLGNNWWCKAQTRFHDKYDEDDISEGDAGDVRLTVPGSDDGELPGYAVFDISAGWQSDNKDRWTNVTLENIGNKTYREVGSGTDANGFNLVLAGGVRF